MGSGFETFVCDPWLLSDRFELPYHNRRHAANVIGMMVQSVSVIGAAKAHKVSPGPVNNRSYT
jgi:hypothetical protein